MRYMNDPRQSRLFDIFEGILSPLAYKELLAGSICFARRFWD